jgi:hypothetical protein
MNPGSTPSIPHAVPKLFRISHEQYRNMVEDVLGVTLDPKLFAGWTPIAQVYGFDTLSEQRIDALALDEQLHTVEKIAKVALTSPALAPLCPAPLGEAPPANGSTLSWDNCASPIVSLLGSRLFRRPVRADELLAYQQFFAAEQGAAASALMPHPFYEALSAVVQSVLLSPHLAFKPELVPSGFEPAERGYATASKLALFFRSSVPDDELLALAQSGALTGDVMRQQAERLLVTYQARFTRNFGGQWLDFRDSLAQDALTLSMQAEVARMFDVVLTSGGPARQLVNPGFTLVDQPLAQHYGLPFDAAGPAVQQIATPARGGLLAQGFFLTRTAAGSEFRRVIHRGLWPLTRLLCEVLPRLDAATLDEISASFDKIDRNLPLSQQMELHRNTAPRCLSCHGLMDPIGLALENYDARGLWRDTYENGSAITSGLEFLGTTVNGPVELAAAIENSVEYRTCVATKLLTYAMNRGPTPEEEEATARELAMPADGSEPQLKNLVVSAFMKALELTEVSP